MKEILKIIIADDNTAIVDCMKKKIEEDERYKVIGVALNENEELELIEKEKPHLVITNLRKNGEYTGFNVIEQYKSKENSPIFFVISGATAYYINDIRRLKIRYYLNKPFSNDTFMIMLDDIYNEVFPKRIMIIQDVEDSVKEEKKGIFDRLYDIMKKRVGR